MNTISLTKHPNPYDPERLELLITCQAGLESLVKKDAEKSGAKNITAQDRIVRCSGDTRTLYTLLMSSRYANRIYIQLAREKITDFDALFALVAGIAWRHHIARDVEIVTEAMSAKSVLTHTPTLQSIMKKAIVSRLTEATGSRHLYENRAGRETHIQLFLLEDIAHIALDITGIPLHRRGYRTEAGDAPIKENLAAALVALTSWRFREPLYDPFCGSGTIAIEAAMLARNIPPGIDRRFAVEWHPFFDRALFESVKKELRAKIYPSGEYRIFASDIDVGMIEIARRNAQRAGVSEDITFFVADFLEKTPEENISKAFPVRREDST